MKTTVNIDIQPEDLRYEMKEIISELVSEEIKAMTRTFAKKEVSKKIKEVLEPLVYSILSEEQLTFGNGNHNYGASHKANLDQRIKSNLISYLDEKCYEYSKTSDRISDRAMKSSSPSSGEPSRMQIYLNWVIEEYVKENLIDKMREQLSEIVDVKEKLQKALNQQLTEMVNSKIK